MAKRTSSNIEEKMVEMKMKNLELLKRHQEIEEDRQLAQTLSSNNNETKFTTTMRNATIKNRTRIISNQNYVQEQNERNQRVVMRRKFDSDRSQRKRDRVQESNQRESIRADLLEYQYPFEHQRTTNSSKEIDEPTSAKKLVLVNNSATRFGGGGSSGRFNQQERAQEHGQRRREERMRRCLLSNNGHHDRPNEFHLDVPSMPIWSNHSLPSAPPPPTHLQVFPPSEHLTNESIEQATTFIPNFIYPAVPFHSNGTIYFAQAPPLMATPAVPPAPTNLLPTMTSLPPSTHFNPFHSNRNQFQFVPIVPRPNEEIPPRFRRLKDHEQQQQQQQTTRPQSFHEFSSNHRNQRSSTKNLPLSAYLNPDDTSYQHRRRTTTQQRISHQFPLALYDPRQYGFDHSNENEIETNSTTIDESCEENPSESIESETKTTTTNINDSGNSSLSTSIHLKESTFDDEENNLSTNDFTSLPSDVSTSDSNIIESLDKLQQDLKLEEDLEKQLENSSESLPSLNGEPTTYDTAHFMQWAKEKFREELAGRLTAQEIEEHDAVLTDDDEDEDFSLPAVIKESQLDFPTLLDDEFDHPNEPIEDLKETLKKNLNLDENILELNEKVRLE